MPSKGFSESVVEAVKRDLSRVPADVRGSALAASALALARELDSAKNSATSKAMCAKALADAMESLLARAPEKKERDSVDDLEKQRAARRARAAAAKSSGGS